MLLIWVCDVDSVIAPNGLFMYRSKLHGGMTQEVLRIFNTSTLMASLKGTEIPALGATFYFSLSRNTVHGVIPACGVPSGTKIGVADSAYHRASEEWAGHLYLPTKLPESGDNLSVGLFEFFVFFSEFCCSRVMI